MEQRKIMGKSGDSDHGDRPNYQHYNQLKALISSVGQSLNLERYQPLLLGASVIILCSSFLLSFYLLYTDLRTTHNPEFRYLTDQGNGEVLPVCAGDSTVKVRIVGSRDVAQNTVQSDSVSIVVMQMENLETGTIYKAVPRIELSDGSVVGKVDFINTAQLNEPLVAGQYIYRHAFFTVTQSNSASNVRSFSTSVTVKPCTG